MYKLTNNGVYGISINLRNRTDVKLVNKEKSYLKWISKLSYMSQKIIDNNSVAIRKRKFTLTFNKSVYVGMWILHLSKGLMYDSIVIILKKNFVATQDYCSLTQIF